MARFEFVLWLTKWLLGQETFEFDWDKGNSSKSVTKHRVSIESAEQVFRNKEMLVPLGIQVEPITDEPRFGALGMDLLGRQISVCFTIRNGMIRIISARPMSRLERTKYASVRKK